MKCSELEITRVWTVEGRLYISASHEPSFFNLIRGIDWTHVDSRKITNKQKKKMRIPTGLPMSSDFHTDGSSEKRAQTVR